MPAWFLVTLKSAFVGEAGVTAATHGGFLDLNAALPSAPTRVVVDAGSPEDAVKAGLFGRIGARVGGDATFHDYGPTTTSTVASDHKPFLIVPLNTPSIHTHVVKLEDWAGKGGCDYDYDDRLWYVDAVGIPSPYQEYRIGAPAANPLPLVEILNDIRMGLTDATVAKWQTAYEQVGGKVQVKPNFVPSDADRFLFRVTDSTNRGDTRPVTVSTSSDPGNTLTLTPVTDGSGVFKGVYESKWCVLVSNDVDDAFSVNDRADNAVNDQTFNVKLGDTLTVSYATSLTNPLQATVTKRVPVRVLKEAKVHITVMTTKQQGQGTNSPLEGIENTTAAQVNEWMTFAQQQYAQTGVKLVWTIQFADQPLKVNATDADVELNLNGLQRPNESDAEIRGSIRGKIAGNNQTIRTVETDDVELFFVNYFSTESGAEYSDLRGISMTYAAAVGTARADLMDTSIVSVKNKRPFTIAHEIGHILANLPGHYSNPLAELTQPNLMRADTSVHDTLEPYEQTRGDGTKYWSTGSKRLNSDQKNAIHTQRPAIVKDHIP